MRPWEKFVPVKNAELYVREIGQGLPIIIIHGGPDFDHTYLLPDMDRLAETYHLIYYDQRGLGKSRGDLRVDEISIEQYLADLLSLQDSLHLERAAILGHSWGGHVAMHYAIHHPERLSNLILMNTAPASHQDYLLFRQERLLRASVVTDQLYAIENSPEFTAGNPETVEAYYRLVFSTTVKRVEDLARLNLRWPQEVILKGRAIEDKLSESLYWAEGFSLLPELETVPVPTLVLHGDYDFVPVECAARIASAIPSARLVVIQDCGHFSYLESPTEVQKVLADFFAGA